MHGRKNIKLQRVIHMQISEVKCFLQESVGFKLSVFTKSMDLWNTNNGRFHAFHLFYTYDIRTANFRNIIQRGADKSLARPTSRCILFDGSNISFDASLVIYIYIYIYIYSINIPPIMIINRYMKLKIFCRCSLFPSWSD